MPESEAPDPAAVPAEAPARKPWWRVALRAGLQIGVTVLLLWLALRKVSLPDLWATLRTLNLGAVVAAFLALNGGMFIAAQRQRRLLQAAGVELPYRLSLWLYYRGMFYNMALPGGISGDGYKGWFVNRRNPGRLRRIITSLVLERINGALGMAIWVALLLWLATPAPTDASLLPWLEALRWLALGGLALVLVGAVVPLRATAEFAKAFRAAVPYSLGVQACQLLFAGLLALALGAGADWIAYLLAFSASSLAAVVPISFGGIGVREYVLSHANVALPVLPNLGLAIALLYNALYLLSAGLSAWVPMPREA